MKKRARRKRIPNEGATLKVPEAAKLARVGEMAIRRGIAEGRVPHMRWGRNLIIPKAAFLRWLDSCGRVDAGSRHYMPPSAAIEARA